MKLISNRSLPKLIAKPERIVVVLLGLATMLVIFQIGLIVLNINTLPPQLPLWYSLPWGEGRLASPIWLWVLPAVSGAVMVLNLVVGQIFSQPILSRILSTSACLISAMSILTLAKIILLGQP